LVIFVKKGPVDEVPNFYAVEVVTIDGDVVDRGGEEAGDREGG